MHLVCAFVLAGPAEPSLTSALLSITNIANANEVEEVVDFETDSVDEDKGTSDSTEHALSPQSHSRNWVFAILPFFVWLLLAWQVQKGQKSDTKKKPNSGPDPEGE